MVLTLHIVVCVILVLLVLLQSGKEGMGVIFGGGSGSLFGSSGAGGVLVKLTTFVALLFVATSLGYNVLTAVKPSKEDAIMDISVDDAPLPIAPPAGTGNIPAATSGTAGEAAPATEGATPADAQKPDAPAASSVAPEAVAPAAPAATAAPATASPEADAPATPVAEPVKTEGATPPAQEAAPDKDAAAKE